MNLDPHLKDEVKKFLIRKMREESEIVTVVTAQPLTASQETAIRALIPESKKELNQEVDTSLIAGMIVKKGSKILDLSIKGRLQNLQNVLTK
ncbi:F0F1 ATP synthase subunit delta [Candidatus Microgenomates bacterium]|nr:F0F1 ATP synthase subunit delta [Candidatus Microgenomates bacterium]